jgi:hypothetical protein
MAHSKRGLVQLTKNTQDVNEIVYNKNFILTGSLAISI